MYLLPQRKAKLTTDTYENNDRRQDAASALTVQEVVTFSAFDKIWDTRQPTSGNGNSDNLRDEEVHVKEHRLASRKMHINF